MPPAALPRAQRPARRMRVCAEAEPVRAATTGGSRRGVSVLTAPNTTTSAQNATVQAPGWVPPTWLLSYLRDRKAEVDEALDAAVPVSTSRASRLVDAMRYSLLAGGKRVRPVLVYAAYDMLAKDDSTRPAATAAAVAVEMIHTMSLIHDDLPCMDDDDFRRGRPTCHKVFGEDTAVLAGDALLAGAFEHMAACGAPPDRVARVIRLLGEAVGSRGLAGGQVADVEAEGNSLVGLDGLRWIHTHKTAVLLRVSCAAGAILAGASDADVEAVSVFAERVGLAFQVHDDVLDVTQSSEALGKTAGKDEAVDKATFPKLLGIERSRQMASDLVARAETTLSPYGERAATLKALADYIIKRNN